MEHFEKYIDKVKNGWNSFKSFFGFGGSDEENANKLDSLSSASTAPSVAGNQMMTTTNANQQSVKYDVNVQQNITSSDPVEAGKQSTSGVTDAIAHTAAMSQSAIAQ